jgi:hypothetical protein
LSNSQGKQFTRKHDFEIQKRSVLEEVEKTEPDPKERNTAVTLVNEGLGITAAGIKVYDDIDSNNQRIANTRQEFMSLFAC